MFRFTTDLPAGNGKLIAHTAHAWGDEISFIAETKFREPRPCWYCFRVEGLTPGVARFHVANAVQFFANFRDIGLFKDDHPVYRVPSGEWQRAEACKLAWEADGLAQVTFEIPHESDALEVAFCYPWLEENVQETMKLLPQLTKKVIGYTNNGLPIHRYCTEDGAKTEKPGVFITCRIHSGEVGGAHALDGMLKFFATAEGAKLLDKICLWVVPIVDGDGVAAGAYGKDQQYGDMNRSYRANRAEIWAVVQDMYRWQERCRALAFLDMHSPSHEMRGVTMPVYLNTERESLIERQTMVQCVNQHVGPTGMELCRVDMPSFNGAATTGGAFATNTLGIPSFTWEVSYQGADRGDVFTLKEYHAYGECMAKGLVDYLMSK